MAGVRSRQPEAELRRAHALVDKIASVFSFSAVCIFVLDLKRLFDRVSFSNLDLNALATVKLNAERLVQDAWLPLLLALVTLIWLLRYKAASRNEIEVLSECFSRTIPRPDWGAVHGSRIVRLLATGLILIFLLLAGLVNRIELYALVVFVWAICDLLGNAAIQQNLMLFFADKRYDPPADDLMREVILRRRAVAVMYWIGRPQIVRITLFLAAIGSAIIMTGSVLTADMQNRRELAYAIVMAAIVVNTTTMAIWRRPRDIELGEIDAAELEILNARVAK